MTSSRTESKAKTVRIGGVPNEKQKQFFASRARYTAYGGARGGGKSWALRRKLTALCLRYAGISCLLVRRSLPELKANHLIPFLREYGELFTYSEKDRKLLCVNGSSISFGYCSSQRDTLRYQGQEFDIIAIDEATQLDEYKFSIFKACLRGVNDFPKRMYLTCNPGGIGHGWVKRLFVDRDFRDNENGDDYVFIPARVYDNKSLLVSSPEYAAQLEALPTRLRDAWLHGKWDVFEGQFFPEFNEELHVCDAVSIPVFKKYFIAFDYGFDMLAALLIGVENDTLTVVSEFCSPSLTLSQAAEAVSELSSGLAEYCVASPDLWNRRQDTGKSGFEIMQACPGMPPMRSADDRRVPGWRILREYLAVRDGIPRLRISSRCTELIRCLPALLCSVEKPEDAAGEPHSITHAPEALRYAVMSRNPLPSAKSEFVIPSSRVGIGKLLY